MSNFKMMVSAIVANAQRELNLETTSRESLDTVLTSTQLHKGIDRLASHYNEESDLDTMTHTTTIKVMSGYDSRYMDKNDFRFAYKTSYRSERKDNSTEYFDYLLRSEYGESARVCRERKVIKESYDFDFSNAAEKLPWKKVASKDTTPSKATVRKIKSLPQNYVPSKPVASTTDYTPKNSDVNTYKVVEYKVYKQAVVLDIISSDVERNEFLTRSTHEVNTLVQHLVFRYQPFTKDGKPNPYDGIKQLKDWLNGQKFITKESPVTLREYLDILKGSIVSIPTAIPYNFAGDSIRCREEVKNGKRTFKAIHSSSDELTVYTLFGEFDTFAEQFAESTKTEYQPISEYFLRDEDSETSETINQEVYVIGNERESYDKRNSIIIKYDCHKEFRQELPLCFNHISSMFD